jgi:hypothetical protein
MNQKDETPDASNTLPRYTSVGHAIPPKILAGLSISSPPPSVPAGLILPAREIPGHSIIGTLATQSQHPAAKQSSPSRATSVGLPQESATAQNLQPSVITQNPQPAAATKISLNRQASRLLLLMLRTINQKCQKTSLREEWD